jgi:hypothetical protein
MFSSFRHLKAVSVAGLSLAFGLAGCAPAQPDVVPHTALNAESGTGPMHFMAPKDGTAYVYDQQNQRLVWSGPVMRNQTVDVEPDKDQIIVAGRVAAMRVLRPGVRNVVYFDPSPEPLPAVQAQTATQSQAQTASQVQPVQPADSNGGSAYNAGVTLTPNVSVQPNSANSVPGSVTVQPGLRVTPATQPAQP